MTCSRQVRNFLPLITQPGSIFEEIIILPLQGGEQLVTCWARILRNKMGIPASSEKHRHK